MFSRLYDCIEHSPMILYTKPVWYEWKSLLFGSLQPHTQNITSTALFFCLSSSLCQFAPWQSTAPALDALQSAPQGDTTTGVSPPAKNSGPERPPEALGCEKALHAFHSSHPKIHPPGLKMITTVHIKRCLATYTSSPLPEVDSLELKLSCIIVLGWARFKRCWRG